MVHLLRNCWVSFRSRIHLKVMSAVLGPEVTVPPRDSTLFLRRLATYDVLTKKRDERTGARLRPPKAPRQREQRGPMPTMKLATAQANGIVSRTSKRNLTPIRDEALERD